MTSKLACAALAVALFSCNPNPTTDYGSVKLSLVGTAPDGTRYRLPEGSTLFLGASGFSLSYLLDGDMNAALISLPVGTYEVTLSQPDGSTSSDWVLDRIDAAGNVIGTVHTTLTTPNPLSVTVTSGQTTPLAYDFGIPTGGTITFSSGNVNVTLNVDDIIATSFTFDTNFSFSVSNASFFNPALTTRLPGVGSSLELQVSGTLTGPWQEIGGSGGEGITPQYFVCAPMQPQTKTGIGSIGWADLVAESGGADPVSALGGLVLCIIDDGTNNYARLRLSRTGTPTTATFTDLVTPGQELWFRVQAAGALPSRVYDFQTHTLALGSLMGDFPNLPLNNLLSTGRVTEITDGFPSNLWYTSRFAGTMSFSFIGH
jgi:hypothetical protein